jgi:hypothetical protein
MKPGSIKPVYLVVALCVISASALALISWDKKQAPDYFYERSYQDTPKKQKSPTREKKVRDLDEALEEMEKVDMERISADVEKEIAAAMKSIDAEKIRKEVEMAMKEVDMVKIQKEIEAAMRSVDMEAIQKEIKNAMKEVDAVKIQLEMQEAMKGFDSEKIKKEVEMAMKEVDMAKIQKEISESMAKVDWKKLKEEMEESKMDMREVQEEMKKVHEELKEIRPKVEKELAEAKVEIEKAKAELKEYKTFVDGLDKDGLINKKENYNIEHKNGELTINGKKASAQTYNKYRSFLEKHRSFSIKKDEDDFDIDMD